MFTLASQTGREVMEKSGKARRGMKLRARTLRVNSTQLSRAAESVTLLPFLTLTRGDGTGGEGEGRRSRGDGWQ